MRLIDADRLMDNLRGNVLIDVTPELEQEIEEQPTFIDKEKVIEELKGEIELVIHKPMIAGKYIKKAGRLRLSRKARANEES